MIIYKYIKNLTRYGLLRSIFIFLFFYSFWMHTNQLIFSKNNAKFSHTLLLLSGDIELNPGPVCESSYTLGHPYLRGFYRSAIYCVFTGERLIPRKDANGNDIVEDITIDEGIQDIKRHFGNSFLYVLLIVNVSHQQES